MRHTQPNRAGRRMIFALPLTLVLAAFGVITTAQATGVGDFVVPSSHAASVQNCVEPTEYMRRNHMEVIRHQRDTTVYGGIRSTKHSLGGCVSCHVGYDAQQTPVPINADGQFCEACHDYAAVNLNCFDCHATIPEGEGWNQETAAAHGHQMSLEGVAPSPSPALAQVPNAASAENEDQ